jgi:CubicO group peptidase (beta-lactamase class C family)
VNCFASWSGGIQTSNVLVPTRGWEALTRADGDHPRTVLEYAREKLFDPLEIDSSGGREERVLLSDPAYDRLTRFDWGTDAAGLHTACCLLRLRPADMIKFGELYLGGGVWHGKQISARGMGRADDGAE